VVKSIRAIEGDKGPGRRREGREPNVTRGKVRYIKERKEEDSLRPYRNKKKEKEEGRVFRTGRYSPPSPRQEKKNAGSRFDAAKDRQGGKGGKELKR